MHIPKCVLEIIVQYAGKNRLESHIEDVRVGLSIWNEITPWCDPGAVDACIAHGITCAADAFYFSQNPLALPYLEEHPECINPRGLYYNPRGVELYKKLVAAGTIDAVESTLYPRSENPKYDPLINYDRSGVSFMWHSKNNTLPDKYSLILVVDEELRVRVLDALE